MQITDLKKLNKYLWEIPQSFKKEMKVPGRICASEKLLKPILEDESLVQLANTACLPGVYKYTLAMPDVHQGYGAPIGGVIAFDKKQGVISPGTCGYDINCLFSKSKILTKHGYYLYIKDFERKWLDLEIDSLNVKRKKKISTRIKKFIKIKPGNKIYRLTSSSNREIVATEDHPFYTPKGMISLKELKKGDKILIFPFEGVIYKKPKRELLVDNDKIKNLFLKLEKSFKGNSLKQIINRLERLNLIPLYSDSPKIPYLLKILGYAFGDGTTYFSNKKKSGRISFYGRREDLEEISKDIEKLGFKLSKVSQRKRNHQIKTVYSTYKFSQIEHSLNIDSSSFVCLLVCLGLPFGNKTSQDFFLPSWIKKNPLWQKRLFLASLFGAKLSSPSVLKEHKYNFYSPILSLNKREGFIKSGEKFLKEISSLLSEFNIEVKKISLRREQINKDESCSYCLRLIISSKSKNLINLWSRVGFEYNQRKKFLGNLGASYLRIKQEEISQRKKIEKLAKNFKKQGFSKKEIFEKLSFFPINKRFLERSIYKGRKTNPRVSFKFLGFKDYLKKNTKDLGESGFVWEEIKERKKIDYKDFVYDFTVEDKNHNFIADSFLVSNCGVRLLSSDLSYEQAKSGLNELIDRFFREIPFGLGRGGNLRLDKKEMDRVLERGIEWLIEKGFAEKRDLDFCEEYGRMKQAQASSVSEKAKKRGADQLGTLGSGNHFLEIQEITEIFDQEIAEQFRLSKGKITILIHSGSRGLGHQICTDYIRIMREKLENYKISLPDPELACAPIFSEEGKRYFSAVACAANFAWANREYLSFLVKKIFFEIFKKKLYLLYDVAHNIVKDEGPLLIHRKGATRAFPANHPAIPKVFQKTGQPVLLPGSMRTASYVLVGTEKALEQTFGSVAHGAGRVLSRKKAKKQIKARDLKRELEKKGILIKCKSDFGLVEEAPEAYKDIEEVNRVINGLDLARKIAKMRPIGVLKG